PGFGICGRGSARTAKRRERVSPGAGGLISPISENYVQWPNSSVLPFRIFLEHPRIDSDEFTLAACENMVVPIQNLRFIDVLAPAYPQFAGFDPERLVERNGFQIIHRDLGGQCDHMTDLVDLSHCLIEDGGDNPAMAIPRRASVALPQPESTHEAVTLLVVGKLQPHALGVVLAATKAVVPLQAHVARIVPTTMSLFRRHEAHCTFRRV